MRLLLTSFGHRLVGEFVSGTVAYVSDATRLFDDHSFEHVERDMLREQGLELVELPIASTPIEEVDRILSSVDGVYVAGGETFDLMYVLRSTGADELLSRHVRGGLPYLGTSAGAVIAGPSIEPVSLLDSPDTAPLLTDHRGLGWIDYVIIPHASGTASPFPIDVFAETVRRFGTDHRLVLLRDGEALLVDDSGIRLV